MKTLSISIDVEPDLHTKKYKGITNGLTTLKKLLDKRKIKATFFITCDCLQKHPKIFQQLKKQGHEIALHGFSHVNFRNLNKKQKQDQIKNSISCFQKHLKQKPFGFRAPQHSIDNQTLEILEQNNFKYDSSKSPWNFYHILFPKKINIPFKDNFTKTSIYKIKNNFYEIPISTCIFPVSALTIRAFSKPLLEIFTNILKIKNNIIFMMHSWDLIEIPKSKLYKKCPKDCFLKKFEIFLDSFKRREFVKLEDSIPPI